MEKRPASAMAICNGCAPGQLEKTRIKGKLGHPRNIFVQFPGCLSHCSGSGRTVRLSNGCGNPLWLQNVSFPHDLPALLLLSENLDSVPASLKWKVMAEGEGLAEAIRPLPGAGRKIQS